MQKIIKRVDKEKNVLQITTSDERWYVRESFDKKTGLPSQYEYVPSVTWITGYYPKGIGFMKWLADKGWDEAEAIKTEAGDKGTVVHHAIEKLLLDKTLAMDTKVMDKEGVEREMTTDEYYGVMTFAKWYNEVNPTDIKTEFVVWGEGYAGTVDILCKIGDENWLIDLKTSQSVWPSHELQVSAYAHTLDMPKDLKLGILQVGYRRNKDGYKFTEVEDQYPLFQAAKQIWAKETVSDKPHTRDYPLTLTIK